MRKTKIICTIGPTSQSEEKLTQLIDAGMNVARFNFSHGNHEEHGAKFKTLRKIRLAKNKPIAALLDTKGPEIRLRDFAAGKVELKEGQEFTLTTEEIAGDETKASISYKGLVDDVKPGMNILIDDGLICLLVNEVTDTEIRCTVMNGGPVSNKKGINVPGADLSMPFISEQDRDDILFGCKLGFDFIACSFTRTADDIRQIREILDSQNSKMQVIAKIESVQGVRNLDEILEVVDGIMVARGDLGVEVPLENVPVLQKKMIKAARAKGKIVITATQMLDSMMHNPRPTRAEATDVANAIYDGTTAIMLSGETANGAYPVEAVKTMSNIAEKAEQDIDYRERRIRYFSHDNADTGTTDAISHASCSIAEDIGASAIIAVTISGFTAWRVSRYRPTCGVVACTTNQRVANQMNLLFGVIPVIIPQQDNEDELFDTAVAKAESTGIIKAGDKVVLTAGVPLGSSGNTNMIRVLEIEE
ncbi:MAG: pyruvate kinase [Eubacterium sp.]|nr:pyruvate kinase [Eubacterium sp.]